jgi:hypothetical protein
MTKREALLQLASFFPEMGILNFHLSSSSSSFNGGGKFFGKGRLASLRSANKPPATNASIKRNIRTPASTELAPGHLNEWRHS